MLGWHSSNWKITEPSFRVHCILWHHTTNGVGRVGVGGCDGSMDDWRDSTMMFGYYTIHLWRGLCNILAVKLMDAELKWNYYEVNLTSSGTTMQPSEGLVKKMIMTQVGLMCSSAHCVASQLKCVCAACVWYPACCMMWLWELDCIWGAALVWWNCEGDDGWLLNRIIATRWTIRSALASRQLSVLALSLMELWRGWWNGGYSL